MISNNLLNLAKIGQLDPVPLSVDLVKRMLLSARQRLRDAEFNQNSSETRFDCAYTAIRVVADIGLPQRFSNFGQQAWASSDGSSVLSPCGSRPASRFWMKSGYSGLGVFCLRY